MTPSTDNESLFNVKMKSTDRHHPRVIFTEPFPRVISAPVQITIGLSEKITPPIYVYKGQVIVGGRDSVIDRNLKISLLSPEIDHD